MFNLRCSRDSNGGASQTSMRGFMRYEGDPRIAEMRRQIELERQLRENPLCAVFGVSLHELERLRQEACAAQIRENNQKLHRILSAGTMAERIAYSGHFSSPDFIVINQEYTLPVVAAAVRGDVKARAFYEAHRLLEDRTVFAWSEPYLERAGRILIDSSAEMKKFMASGEDEKKGIDEERDRLLSGFSTYHHFEESSGNITGGRMRRFGREASKQFALYQSFMQTVRSAHLIEDYAIALDIPWSDRGKLILLDQLGASSWGLGANRYAADSIALLSVLRQAAGDLDGVEAEFQSITDDFHKLIDWTAQQDRARREQQHAQFKHAASLKPSAAGRTEIQEISPARSPDISFKSSLATALHLHCGSLPNARDMVRSLNKLVGGCAGRYTQVVTDLRCGVSPEDIILRLRRDRRYSALNRSESVDAAALEEDERQMLPYPEKVVREVAVEYSERAREQRIDGRARRAIERELEKLVDMPALADRKKIKETVDVWELRIHSPALRVYFYEPGNHTIAILWIGKKSDQELEIPRLQRMRDDFHERWKANLHIA